MKALILLAHGSRNSTAYREVKGLADAVGRELPETTVLHAFLDMREPSLPEALEQVVHAGATRVDVLPLFLNSGNHVTRDIPDMIQEARRKRPSVEVNLLRHVGAHPTYRSLVRDMAGNPERYFVDLQ